MDGLLQTTTQWERDEDDTVEEKENDITKAAGFEITTIFPDTAAVCLVQVCLRGKLGT